MGSILKFYPSKKNVFYLKRKLHPSEADRVWLRNNFWGHKVQYYPCKYGDDYVDIQKMHIKILINLHLEGK